MTELNAKNNGYDIKVGKFPFKANGKAIALGEEEGFIKTIFHGIGSKSIGAKSKLATRRPRINPIALLTRRSVGVVLICCVSFFLSCRNNVPINREKSPKMPASNNLVSIWDENFSKI